MTSLNRVPSTDRFHLIARIVRALMLDYTLYEEVANDRVGLSQAIGIVILVGITSGMGLRPVAGTIGALIGVAVSLLGWAVLSGLTLAAGRWVLRGEPTSLRIVATCLGFADAPALLSLLGVLPNVGVLVRVIVWFWLLAACMVAARAAFRVSAARGAAIGGLGFAAYMLIGLGVGIWSS